jgi:DNA-binding IscR family transcriptional regulator
MLSHRYIHPILSSEYKWLAKEEPVRADSEFLPLYKSLQESILRMTEVLVLLVASCPHSVTLKEMARRTRCNVDDLRDVIQSLQQHDPIKPYYAQSDSWQLVCHPSEVTLESVLTCIISNQEFVKFSRSSRLHGIDALLVPAFMSIAQNVLKTLRQFSLDRVPEGRLSMKNLRYPIKCSHNISPQ